MPPHAIGIDIGGTFTKIAVVAETGEVVRLETLPTAARGDPQRYLDAVLDKVADIVGDVELGGIGLAAPGFLSSDRRSIRYNPNTPALVGIDFLTLLERFGLPLRLEQDLNVPTVAEYCFGEFRGASRLMTASIGTGLGAGLMVDGRLIDLFGGTIGDTGHIILQPGGPTCTAGCHGCAEALIATPNIERLAQARGLAPKEPPSAQEVIAAAREGQPWAAGIIEQVADWLGQWLAGLAAIFLPSHILLCGGVAEVGELLRSRSEVRFRALGGPAYTQSVIALSRFGARAGVVGAAAPFLTTAFPEG
jgi:glucokinase